ncbi:MAG: CaiB/BaiF CoA-transferase family protein [Pirellulales bacterium]
MNQHAYPLQGVKVLDLSRILAGPFCTQLLADLGADVVKVERPGGGDDTRQWGPPFVEGGGPSAYYLSTNRGKRSLALALDHPASRPLLDDLLRQADVLVENFLPASLERFGLQPDRLRQLNPRLVVCSISGYGRASPLADVPGYDLMMQAEFGLMSITGEPDAAPMKVGVAITDVITGLYAAVTALAGLVARGKGKAGWAFDLALADCTLASLVNVAQAALLTGEPPRRYGNAHPQIVPYEAFATADGHIVLAIGADRQWQRFCQAAGRPDWAFDPRFATNPARVQHRDSLVPRLRELLAGRTTAAWRGLLTSADVPHTEVLSLDQVFASTQVAARQMVLPVTDAQGRSYPLLSGAVHWSGEPARHASAPPEVGQHSDEVLRDWLGYTAEAIQALRQSGAMEG